MIKIIDTEPDTGKHTPLCSCNFCIEMKKVVFGNMPTDFQKELKQLNPMLYQILLEDKIWKPIST